MDTIAESAYGIHDISRTELDSDNGLPRFNMPLELGVFLGCKRYGGRKQRLKCCLVLDREKYRYQKFVSDIAGQDVRSHDANPRVAVSQVRKFLRTQSRRSDIPGETRIWNRFRLFLDKLPALCEELEITVAELEFVDYQNFVIAWLKKRGAGPL